jgi:hypothetical protein
MQICMCKFFQHETEKHIPIKYIKIPTHDQSHGNKLNMHISMEGTATEFIIFGSIIEFREYIHNKLIIYI